MEPGKLHLLGQQHHLGLSVEALVKEQILPGICEFRCFLAGWGCVTQGLATGCEVAGTAFPGACVQQSPGAGIVPNCRRENRLRAVTSCHVHDRGGLEVRCGRCTLEAECEEAKPSDLDGGPSSW